MTSLASILGEMGPTRIPEGLSFVGYSEINGDHREFGMSQVAKTPDGKYYTLRLTGSWLEDESITDTTTIYAPNQVRGCIMHNAHLVNECPEKCDKSGMLSTTDLGLALMMHQSHTRLELHRWIAGRLEQLEGGEFMDAIVKGLLGDCSSTGEIGLRTIKNPWVRRDLIEEVITAGHAWQQKKEGSIGNLKKALRELQSSFEASQVNYQGPNAGTWEYDHYGYGGSQNRHFHGHCPQCGLGSAHIIIDQLWARIDGRREGPATLSNDDWLPTNLPKTIPHHSGKWNMFDPTDFMNWTPDVPVPVCHYCEHDYK